MSSSSTKASPHRLNKSLFASGVQCAKRLHIEYHNPKGIPEPSGNRKLLWEIGLQLTELARQGFPNGQLVETEDFPAAVAQTHELLADSSGGAIFNAAFAGEGLEISCDILLPGRDKELDIFEVKSGTKAKPRHIMDVALQIYVLESLGYTVRSASLVHMDSDYRHKGGTKYPAQEIFKNVDVTKRARKRLTRIPDYLERFQALLDDPTTLELPTGTWCLNPIPCAFLADCRKTAPEHPLLELPDLNPKQEFEFHQEGIEGIQQIEARRDGLTLTQRRVLKSMESGKLVVEPQTLEELDDVVFPCCFLSLGFSLQVLPRLAATRPWQQLPFMWTAQILHEDGKVETKSFLADGKEDPRPDFLQSLATCISEVGTVLTYTPHFESNLQPIIADLPDEKSVVVSLLNCEPLSMDLSINSGVYHPDMRGQFNLEATYKALVPKGSRKKGLGIKNEEQASLAFGRLLNPRTRATTRKTLQEDLQAFGEARSQMMLEVYQALKA